MGLRERKKQRTAEAIEAAALRLFAERGYAATTVADIAEAADISPRTFFGYFPSKESVLFGDFDATFASLRARLDEREAGENAIDALRAWIVSSVEAGGLPDEHDLQRRRVIDSTEALAAHERQLLERFEVLLAEAFAVDLGEEPNGLRPRIAGAAAAAVLVVLRPSSDDMPGSSDQEAFTALDQALSFLRGGLTVLEGNR